MPHNTEHWMGSEPEVEMRRQAVVAALEELADDPQTVLQPAPQVLEPYQRPGEPAALINKDMLLTIDPAGEQLELELGRRAASHLAASWFEIRLKRTLQARQAHKEVK